MLRIGQRITLSGEGIEPGVDDQAIVDGFKIVDGGYIVYLLFPSEWLEEE